MRNFAFFLLLFCLPTIMQAQDNFFSSDKPAKINAKYETSVHGTIYFKDGEELRCDFSYNPVVDEGLVIVHDDTRESTYTVFQIDGFSFFDPKKHRKRSFYAIPVKTSAEGPIRETFLEIFYESPYYSLLGKDDVQVTYYVQSPGAGGNGTNYSSVPFKTNSSTVKKRSAYYLMDMQTGEIANFDKNVLLTNLDKRAQKELKKFIRDYSLGFNRIEDCIQIMDFYIRQVEHVHHLQK